jgi:hypothetical protein
VFHCTIHPDVVSSHESQQKDAQDEPQVPTASGTSASNDTHTSVPASTSTGDLPQAQPVDDASSAIPPMPAPPQLYTIPMQTSDTTQQPTSHSRATQTPSSLTRQMQFLPIQYQAVLVKYPLLAIKLTSGSPFLIQVPNPQPILRLPSDTAIPVRTHTGERAYIINPDGVTALARQGCRIHAFQLLHPIQPHGPGAQAVVGQLQIIDQQPQQRQIERRFVGLTDLIALFRRRGVMQHIWLLCKLAFMVGLFSSNNASWRRIFGLCLAAAGIYCIFIHCELTSMANRRIREMVTTISKTGYTCYSSAH